jgi:hypothetical protein
MNLKTARDLIRKCGLTIIETRIINNGSGTQLRTAEGPIFDVYNSGRCVLGGTNQHLLGPLLPVETNKRRRGSKSEARVDDRVRRLVADNKLLKTSLADREFVIESMTEYLKENRRRRVDDDWQTRRRTKRWQ